MRLGKFSHLAIASLALGTLAFGCASSGGDDKAPAPTTSHEFDDRSAPTDTGMNPDGERGLLENVLFDFDSAAIRSDQRAVLQGDVSKIGANPSWKMITIEGHCDERGSEEYKIGRAHV